MPLLNVISLPTSSLPESAQIHALQESKTKLWQRTPYYIQIPNQHKIKKVVLQIRRLKLVHTASPSEKKAAILLCTVQSLCNEPIKYCALAPKDHSCCWQKQKTSAHLDLIIMNAEVTQLFPKREVTHITYPVCY